MDNNKIENFIDTDTKVHLEPVKNDYYEFTNFRICYNRLNSLLQISWNSKGSLVALVVVITVCVPYRFSVQS